MGLAVGQPQTADDLGDGAVRKKSSVIKGVMVVNVESPKVLLKRTLSHQFIKVTRLLSTHPW